MTVENFERSLFVAFRTRRGCNYSISKTKIEDNGNFKMERETNMIPMTEKSLKLADRIIELLIEEQCTVADAKTILYGVASGVSESSTVQKANYWERFKDALSKK